MILKFDEAAESHAFLYGFLRGVVAPARAAVVSASKSFSQFVVDLASEGLEDAGPDDVVYNQCHAFGPDPDEVEAFGPDVLVFLSEDEIGEEVVAEVIRKSYL